MFVVGARHLISHCLILPALYDSPEIVVPINPFKEKSAFRFDSDKAAKRWGLINDLVGVTLIDNHKMLVNTWKAIQNGGMKEEAINSLKAPLFESEAMEYASRWNDYAFKNTVCMEWAKFAKEKYEKTVKLSGGTSIEYINLFLTLVRYFFPICIIGLLFFLFIRKLILLLCRV